MKFIIINTFLVQFLVLRAVTVFSGSFTLACMQSISDLSLLLLLSVMEGMISSLFYKMFLDQD